MLIIDQIIIWSVFTPEIRFALSTIHPIVFMVASIYITLFTKKYANVTLTKAALIVIPGLIISGPLIGSIFR